MSDLDKGDRRDNLRLLERAHRDNDQKAANVAITRLFQIQMMSGHGAVSQCRSETDELQSSQPHNQSTTQLRQCGRALEQTSGR